MTGFYHLVWCGKAREMTPRMVRIISPDKCQIINPYLDETTDSKSDKVANQSWLDWEKKYGMPLRPKVENYPQILALSLELDFQKSLELWENRLIRKISNFRFKTGENVYWKVKEVLFESFNYNSAVILFLENAMWTRKTVHKSELSKFQLGSIHLIQRELDNGSLILVR